MRHYNIESVVDSVLYFSSLYPDSEGPINISSPPFGSSHVWGINYWLIIIIIIICITWLLESVPVSSRVTRSTLLYNLVMAAGVIETVVMKQRIGFRKSRVECKFH